jgi:hypothetical protein
MEAVETIELIRAHPCSLAQFGGMLNYVLKEKRKEFTLKLKIQLEAMG